jgi:hypothetical protein
MQAEMVAAIGTLNAKVDLISARLDSALTMPAITEPDAEDEAEVIAEAVAEAVAEASEAETEAVEETTEPDVEVEAQPNPTKHKRHLGKYRR